MTQRMTEHKPTNEEPEDDYEIDEDWAEIARLSRKSWTEDEGDY